MIKVPVFVNGEGMSGGTVHDGGVSDISDHGGWRGYRATLAR